MPSQLIEGTWELICWLCVGFIVLSAIISFNYSLSYQEEREAISIILRELRKDIECAYHHKAVIVSRLPVLPFEYEIQTGQVLMGKTPHAVEEVAIEVPVNEAILQGGDQFSIDGTRREVLIWKIT